MVQQETPILSVVFFVPASTPSIKKRLKHKNTVFNSCVPNAFDHQLIESIDVDTESWHEYLTFPEDS